MKTQIVEYIKTHRLEAVLALFIILRLLIGLFRVADYGISFDEGFGYQDLEMNDAYISEIFEQITHHQALVDTTGYEEYYDKYYGIAARFPLLLFQRYAESRWQIRDIFLVHHYFQYIWFVLAVLAMFWASRLSGMNNKKALIACLSLVMMPRLFADAAYNFKDILFLALFIIAYAMGLWLVQRWTIARMICFAFFMALCVNARYIGAVIFLVYVILYLIKGDEHKWRRVCATALMTAVFYYVMSPFMWKNPIRGALELVSGFNSFGWNGYVKVWGRVYRASELPRYYLLSYMLVTIPLWVGIPSVVGGASGIIGVIKWIKSRERKKPEVAIILRWIPTILLVLILLLDLVTHPVKYDGWRHFYFLYPLVGMTAVLGLEYLTCIIKKQNYRRLLGIFVGGLVVADLFWMEFNHPYEYMYFNPAGRMVEDKFEGDYWLVSTYDAVKEVLNASEKDDIRIWLSQDMVFFFLTDEERGRLLWQTETADGADVIILHERTGLRHDLSDVDWTQYVVWKEKYVDSKLLYAIYLKKYN